MHCKKLNITAWPDSLTEICDSAFMNSNLYISQQLPSSLTTIGSRAFMGCTNLVISGQFPYQLVNIYNEAFSGCTKLARPVTFSPKMITLGSNVFDNCGIRVFNMTQLPNNINTTWKLYVDDYKQELNINLKKTWHIDTNGNLLNSSPHTAMVDAQTMNIRQQHTKLHIQYFVDVRVYSRYNIIQFKIPYVLQEALKTCFPTYKYFLHDTNTRDVVKIYDLYIQYGELRLSRYSVFYRYYA